ncbi:MAG: hypothetical protein AAGH79_01255 [Bacteroidota bacterium]
MDIWLHYSRICFLLLSVMPPLIGAILLLLVYLPIQFLFHTLWAGLFKGIYWLRSTTGRVPCWAPALLCSIATILIALYNSSMVYMPWLSRFRAFFYETAPKSGIKPQEILLVWIFLSLLASLVSGALVKKAAV